MDDRSKTIANHAPTASKKPGQPGNPFFFPSTLQRIRKVSFFKTKAFNLWKMPLQQRWISLSLSAINLSKQ
uniref:Uncharacterized protein n=1 Tax=Taeniopygia guttata TaxID=59729 RepID=A0A674GHB8_TAEGU